MSHHKWREDDTIFFIERYKALRCLWDTNHPEKKNLAARRTAYQKLQKELKDERNINITIYEVRMKIKNLRSTYCQEFKKIRNFETCGKEYTPRLCWFNNFSEVFAHSSYHLHGDCLQSSIEDIIQENDEDEDQSEDPTEEFIEIKTEPHCKRKRNSTSEYVLSSPVIQKPVNEEFSLFGQLIAAQLMKLPLSNAVRLQAEIHSLISKERIKLLNISDPFSEVDCEPGTSQSWREGADEG